MKPLISGQIRQIKTEGRSPVIPDFKRISPQYGELFGGKDPVPIAQMMEQLGAPALSVVTEGQNFGGSMELLQRIAGSVSIPVLRKDFIHGERELKETAEAGAAAILLICSCLTREELVRLYHVSSRYHLEPLIEVHTEAEMQLAQELGAKLIGINNRNIRVLEKDHGTVARTEWLAALKPKGAVLISESGIETRRQVQKAIKAGADAVLIGSALWLAEGIGAAYRVLSGDGDEC